MSSNTEPKVVISCLEVEPQKASQLASLKIDPQSGKSPSSRLFSTSYTLLRILLFGAIFVEILITAYEHFEPHNVSSIEAREHSLFGSHFAKFCTVSLVVNIVGLAALLAPIGRIGGRALLTLLFLFTQQASFALLLIDLFQPDTQADCSGDEQLGISLVSCGFLGGLRELADRSGLFVAKLVSLLIGLLYLLQVLIKHGRKMVCSAKCDQGSASKGSKVKGTSTNKVGTKKDKGTRKGQQKEVVENEVVETRL